MKKVLTKYKNVLYGIILVGLIGIPIFLYLSNKWHIFEYFIVIVTGFSAYFIWLEGKSINKQLKIQTIADLYKEWDSLRMRKVRANSFNNNPNDLDGVELVLEFLEKIACHYNNDVLDQDILWDFFEWYILRYYYYNKDNINKIRTKWGNDKFLYCELEKLYPKLLKQEVKALKKKEKEIENNLKEQRDNFIKSEKYVLPKQ